MGANIDTNPHSLVLQNMVLNVEVKVSVLSMSIVQLAGPVYVQLGTYDI